MYVESNMETYVSMCKVDSQRERSLRLRELKQGLCSNLERWAGEGDGRKSQERRDIYIHMAYSC